MKKGFECCVGDKSPGLIVCRWLFSTLLDYGQNKGDIEKSLNRLLLSSLNGREPQA